VPFLPCDCSCVSVAPANAAPAICAYFVVQWFEPISRHERYSCHEPQCGRARVWFELLIARFRIFSHFCFVKIKQRALQRQPHWLTMTSFTSQGRRSSHCPTTGIDQRRVPAFIGTPCMATESGQERKLSTNPMPRLQSTAEGLCPQATPCRRRRW
jgi:hypothetical protein